MICTLGPSSILANISEILLCTPLFSLLDTKFLKLLIFIEWTSSWLLLGWPVICFRSGCSSLFLCSLVSSHRQQILQCVCCLVMLLSPIYIGSICIDWWEILLWWSRVGEREKPGILSSPLHLWWTFQHQLCLLHGSGRVWLLLWIWEAPHCSSTCWLSTVPEPYQHHFCSRNWRMAVFGLPHHPLLANWFILYLYNLCWPYLRGYSFSDCTLTK